MEDNTWISLGDANDQFTKIFTSLRREDRTKFMHFAFNKFVKIENDTDNLENDIEGQREILDDPVARLNVIAEDIKERLPLNATLLSESINKPDKGENADCLDDFTVHVDEFLYNEEDLEDLVENKKLKKYYCKECRSKNIEPLIYISHSMPRDALWYIFDARLPTLKGQTVLDIGSRLGAVLYGAYLFTDAAHIIGVEMNKEFCDLQNEIIKKYEMCDRIKIIHSRIEEAGDIIESANVIVVNNAFEFYLPEDKQIEIWQYLKKHIKKNTILVTVPYLETTFKNVDPKINLNSWVKTYNKPEEDKKFTEFFADDETQYDLAFYQVL